MSIQIHAPTKYDACRNKLQGKLVTMKGIELSSEEIVRMRKRKNVTKTWLFSLIRDDEGNDSKEEEREHF